MKRTVIIFAAALTVSTVLAGFKYECEWGAPGTGNGQFHEPVAVAVAPNGNVYVADYGNDRIQYFTAIGVFIGKWSEADVAGVAVAPVGNVYTGGNHATIRFYSRVGSLFGSWQLPTWWVHKGCDVAPNGDVYVSVGNESSGVFRYAWQGSLIYSWPAPSGAVAVAPNGNLYIVSRDVARYYTTSGSLLGSWGSRGSGKGQFWDSGDVVVAPNGQVFVADTGNDRIQQFTPAGSFLGMWGSEGYGRGYFLAPTGVAVSPTGNRVYVADRYNHRIQCFAADNPAVSPASLGKVRALFK
jgi:tripartite motif-containing protein 71